MASDSAGPQRIFTEIPQTANLAIIIGTMATAVIFTFLRVLARWLKLDKAPFELEDIFMYFSMIAFILHGILYIVAMPALYKATELAALIGLDWTHPLQPVPQWARSDEFRAETTSMLKELLATQMMFYCTLWLVKCSIICLVRGVVDRIPLYERIMKGISVFVAITFIGCVITSFESCSSMDAWFTAGACSTPRDNRAKTISLWFVLSTDLSTDAIIMVLPAIVLYNLQMTIKKKMIVGVVFFFALITMASAIARSVFLNRTDTNGQVSSSWLIFWGSTECTVAIIVGSLPTFTWLVRKGIETPKFQSFRVKATRSTAFSGGDRTSGAFTAPSSRPSQDASYQLQAFDTPRASRGLSSSKRRQQIDEISFADDEEIGYDPSYPVSEKSRNGLIDLPAQTSNYGVRVQTDRGYHSRKATTDELLDLNRAELGAGGISTSNIWAEH